MSIKDRMSGNEAVSYAIRQINPDVMPAFPITPSTEIPQMVSSYIANGEIDTEFIPVESEHSAMSAAIGAEAAGTLRPCKHIRRQFEYYHYCSEHTAGAVYGSRYRQPGISGKF